MTITSAKIAYRMLCKLYTFMQKEFTHKDTYLLDKLGDVKREFERIYQL